MGKTFREVYLGDPEFCGWTMRQEKLSAPKLRQFTYFLQRMEDLTTKNLGICGKADEAERQLRDRILQVCCEEQMEKLAGRRQGLWKTDARTTGDARGRMQG